jgi:hypothetical protein
LRGIDQLRLGGEEPVGGPPVHPGGSVGVDHGVGDVHHLAGDVVHQAGNDLVLFGLVGAKHPVGVVAFGVQRAAGRCIRTAASTPQVDHVDDWPWSASNTRLIT